MTHPPRTRSRGERGIAVVMTALSLLPLMIFAAFGVDLASWHARVSYLQKSADAAALAGTVWMPDISKATTIACESLAKNGVSGGPDCGSGAFTVEIGQGSTATSLRVDVTDPNARRYFSQVFRGEQSLTRGAEAEYNLPLPLGSPLNYFGGDRSSVDATTPAPVTTTTWAVNYPADYQTRVPANRTGTGCNLGTAASQNLGSWPATGSYNAGTYISGAPQCTWGSSGGPSSGTTAIPPPDHTTRVPTNGTSSTGCKVREDGNGSGVTIGRWQSSVFNTGTGGTAAPCTWPVWSTTASTIPPFSNTRAPSNVPCRVGYENTGTSLGAGYWPNGTPANYTAPPAAAPVGGSTAQGNRLCIWTTGIQSTTTTTTPPPNNIPVNRNPGFWAMIYGPGQYAANGDAFSTRCTTQFNCPTVENLQYRALTDQNRGEWYVIDVPTGVSGSLVVNVFDASYNHVSPDRIMDSTEGTGTPDFETEYRVFKQTNPLDFNARTAMFGGSSSNDPVYGGCWWKLRKEAGFNRDWKPLCTLSGVQPGDRYLVNVRTNTVGAANEAGNNGYAIEVVANGDRDASPGPSIYAYGDMVIANQNACLSGTCDGTFYLAKVDPKYAGKTLVIQLYDGGDSTGAGTSTVYPMKPSTTVPKPVVNVDDSECAYTATPAPNDYIDTSDPRIHSGVMRVPSSSPPDSGDGSCGIVATRTNVRQYNGEWMNIRVQIPATYSCNMAINTPETVANSCWWGIRYRFNGNASDTTTWSARIEGNPVHLTH